MNILAQLLALPFTVSSFIVGGFVRPKETNDEVQAAFVKPIDDLMKDETARYIQREKTLHDKADRSTVYWQKQWQEKQAKK